MFLDDEGFEKSDERIGKDELYQCYRTYCQAAGFSPLTKVNFGRRLVKKHRVEESRSQGCRFWNMSRKKLDD
jgi:phage/plasmid-associated DNA primase